MNEFWVGFGRGHDGMDLQLFLLIVVVVTALGFDFTNGFHDTANAMATSIASGALAPKVAVALSASLNLVGAFLSTAVAATIATGLVNQHLVTLELVFAGLVGGIVWNLLTWLLGIPSSSSHALIGGIIGATLAAVGGHGVIWKHLVTDVIAPALVSPLIAGLVAATGTWLIYRTVRGISEKRTDRGFRYGQIGSASLVSLAHGTNDAQKTMGVIFLALISYGAAKSGDGDQQQETGYHTREATDEVHYEVDARSDYASGGQGKQPRCGHPAGYPPAHLRAGFAESATEYGTGDDMGGGQRVAEVA